MVKRGLNDEDLKSQMRTGIYHFLYQWIEQKNIGDATFFFRFRDSVYYVDIIKGKAVFEDIDFGADDKLSEWEGRILFGEGEYTVLSNLTLDVTYTRIKEFYSDILENCLSKTINDQHYYVFRFNKPNSTRPLKPGLIEDSEEYIRNLPENPSKDVHENLGDQILYGILEYAFHAKDQFGVEMSQYAKALIKKLY